MGGDPTSGGKGTVVGMLLNPFGEVFGREVAGHLEPFAAMTEQFYVNLHNWVSGDEAFAGHKNYFGEGWTADFGHWILGMDTVPARQENPLYNRNTNFVIQPQARHELDFDFGQGNGQRPIQTMSQKTSDWRRPDHMPIVTENQYNELKRRRQKVPRQVEGSTLLTVDEDYNWNLLQ